MKRSRCATVGCTLLALAVPGSAAAKPQIAFEGRCDGYGEVTSATSSPRR